MSDLFRKQQACTFAVILVLYWVLVGSMPFMIISGGPPDPALWLMFLAFTGYFIWTGVRAWRRKWKARFILRIVVPGALFCASWIAIGVVAWLGKA